MHIKNYYDAIVVAVAHKEFLDMGVTNIRKFGFENAVVFDVKGQFDSSLIDGSL